MKSRTWSILVGAATALAAVGAVAIGGTPAAAAVNHHPTCEDFTFAFPPAGESVDLDVSPYSADPDGDALHVTDVFFVSGSSNGTAEIVDDLVVRFTSTPDHAGESVVYWIVSDGRLDAQCMASAGDTPSSDNG